jgi:cell fate regulator YaaT (PSP1 superfamily)
MKKVVGIRFKPAGKVYDFDSGAFVLKRGDHVVVETEQGLGFGTVVIPPAPFKQKSSAKPLKQVFRLANRKDFLQVEKNRESEKAAYDYCQKSIKEIGLTMNLFSVEKSFDGKKLTFFFTSDGRVDFRQLVKVLVKKFSVRIEMRQVGIRNQAKMCGGIGRCGREICCSSFLGKFNPVAIKMAKEQSLSLNPTKISGQCGRLMCCLTYEYDTYLKLKRNLPKIGKSINTPYGKTKVIRHNPLRRRITIKTEDGKEIETSLDKLGLEKQNH